MSTRFLDGHGLDVCGGASGGYVYGCMRLDKLYAHQNARSVGELRKGKRQACICEVTIKLGT